MKTAAILLLSALTTAAALRAHGRQNVIEDDSYFYGESEPVYPSRTSRPDTWTAVTHLSVVAEMNPGLADWVAAQAQARAIVSQMTVEEKAKITVGVTPGNRCSGLTGSAPRLGFPGLCTTGAGNGIRQADFVNGWPAGIHIGASFNRHLTYQRGVFMGKEAKKKGSNALGGPVMGPLGRMALHGRNWEGFSNDRKPTR